MSLEVPCRSLRASCFSGAHKLGHEVQSRFPKTAESGSLGCLGPPQDRRRHRLLWHGLGCSDRLNEGQAKFPRWALSSSHRSWLSEMPKKKGMLKIAK